MRILSAAIAACLLLSACSSSEPEEAATATPSPTPTATETETSGPSDALPLTGEPTDDPLLDRPVTAVKIENTPSAYPLAGIEQADLVYEQIVEGGVTRFAALFHSELPEQVGPVRSGRLVDVPLLDPWSSVMVYSGARDDVTSALSRADHIGLVADPGRGPVFSRAPGRPGSHDLMANLPLALDQGSDLEDVTAVPDTALAFDQEPPSGGGDAETASIRMTRASTASWDWDADAGLYRRSQNGQPLLVTGEGRIGASTVVAILTDIGTGGCCDTAGNPFTVTRLEGSGNAVVWRDGQRFDVSWRKESQSAHLELLGDDGQPFPLAPGPSWWHLAGTGSVALPEDASS